MSDKQIFRMNQQQPQTSGQMSTQILNIDASGLQSSDMNQRTCYLCDSRNLQPGRNLFANKVQTATASSTSKTESLATVLSEILQRPIEEDSVHSTMVCQNCYYSCNEYELLSQRLQHIRANIVNSYTETVSKYVAQGIDIESNHMRLNYDSKVQQMDATFEALDDDVGFGMHTDHIHKVLSTNDNKRNKIVLIKSKATPIFGMSNMDPVAQQSGDDSQESAYQTVILEEINDTEFVEPDTSEHYILTDKEYLDTDDLMIDVIQDESNEVQTLDDDTTNASCDDSQSKDGRYEIRLDTNGTQNEMVVANGYTVKSTGIQRTLRTTTSTTSSGSSGGVRQGGSTRSSLRKLFIRDGMEFKCVLCDANNSVIYDTKTIAIHLKTDHNERIYVCSVCGLDFRKRTPYNEHMDEHTSGTKDGVYECEMCQTVYTDIRLFRAHKKSHSANMKIWTCKDCNKTYSSKNLLDEHMNMHTGDRPYKCPHCVKDFASKYTLTAHMKIHYDRKRPFQCSECNKSFFSNQNLVQHERTHTGIKEYECEVCHKKFGTPHNLDVHKIVHTGHKPFVCRHCGKGFARRAEIKDHERTHTGERPYKCDLCESSFAQRSNLMSHKRATHFNDKRYKCERCDRSFKRRRLLEYHIKASHTGERPYRCDVCSSTFVYPEHFKKHRRIHSGIKPFLCEVCGKAFNSRDNRNAHRYVHSDKKPYECVACGAGYMRKPLLYAHMESANHLNDSIIINQPHISSKEGKEIVLSDTEDNSMNDTDIVYLNLNDDDPLDDDEYVTFDGKTMLDDEPDSSEEHLIVDGQVHLSGDTGDSSDGRSIGKTGQKRLQIYRLAQTQNAQEDDQDIEHNHKLITQDHDDSEILQHDNGDPLHVQICVPDDSYYFS